MSYYGTYRIFPLGDSAITIDFGNYIDPAVNARVISLFHYLQNNPLEGMLEAVPAYSTLTVYYDVVYIRMKKEVPSAYDYMRKNIEKLLITAINTGDLPPNHIKIPVCYDGQDMEWIMQQKRLSAEEIIQIHSETIYRVYMLGFLPGFPYMGEVDERIAVPRKQQPRLKVEAGSIGIAGKQTGIYPVASPGGWQIIGRTPLNIFDVKREPSVLVNPGDTVQFYPISKDEFENY
jgi:inhibitor of KinA